MTRYSSPLLTRGPLPVRPHSQEAVPYRHNLGRRLRGNPSSGSGHGRGRRKSWLGSGSSRSITPLRTRSTARTTFRRASTMLSPSFQNSCSVRLSSLCQVHCNLKYCLYRAILEVRQLVLLVHCLYTTNTRSVSNQPLYHYCSTSCSTTRLRYQGVPRGPGMSVPSFQHFLQLMASRNVINQTRN